MPVKECLYKLPKVRNPAMLEAMKSNYELLLNPAHYPLTPEGKKRLKWMHIIEHESAGKVTLAARTIGVSRQWLSGIYNVWLKSGRNPTSLEPRSRAPHCTDNRKRISSYTEEQIVRLRRKYPCFGKEKIYAKLKDIAGTKACPTTVNNYLAKHKLLNVRLSNRNRQSYRQKVQLKYKVRPPAVLKDLKPGALVEKDMKYVVKFGHSVEPYWFQQTEIDSFTRVRTLELTKDFESSTVAIAHQKAVKRFPFPVAAINTDCGSENQGAFEDMLEINSVVHFYSRTATPTDNPRVERSHLTDEMEFYGQGNIHKTFKKQGQALSDWEHFYNYDRPHQALGNLTPIQFYGLWKQNPKAAYAIKDQYQKYLRRQRRRQGQSRQMRKKEQIEKLMAHIDTVLTADSYH